MHLGGQILFCKIRDGVNVRADLESALTFVYRIPYIGILLNKVHQESLLQHRRCYHIIGSQNLYRGIILLCHNNLNFLFAF